MKSEQSILSTHQYDTFTMPRLSLVPWGSTRSTADDQATRLFGMSVLVSLELWSMLFLRVIAIHFPKVSIDFDI